MFRVWEHIALVHVTILEYTVNITYIALVTVSYLVRMSLIFEYTVDIAYIFTTSCFVEWNIITYSPPWVHLSDMCHLFIAHIFTSSREKGKATLYIMGIVPGETGSLCQGRLILSRQNTGPIHVLPCRTLRECSYREIEIEHVCQEV